MIGTHARDVPVRDRKQAALDMALKTLRNIERECYEAETVRYVRKQIARISDILNA